MVHDQIYSVIKLMAIPGWLIQTQAAIKRFRNCFNVQSVMSRGLAGYFISQSAGVVGPARDTGRNLRCAGRLTPTKNIGMSVTRRGETSFLIMIMMMIVTGGEIQVEPQLRDVGEGAHLGEEETAGNVGGSRRKQESGILAAQFGVLMEWVRECG